MTPQEEEIFNRSWWGLLANRAFGNGVERLAWIGLSASLIFYVIVVQPDRQSAIESRRSLEHVTLAGDVEVKTNE